MRKLFVIRDCERQPLFVRGSRDLADGKYWMMEPSIAPNLWLHGINFSLRGRRYAIHFDEKLAIILWRWPVGKLNSLRTYLRRKEDDRIEKAYFAGIKDGMIKQYRFHSNHEAYGLTPEEFKALTER